MMNMKTLRYSLKHPFIRTGGLLLLAIFALLLLVMLGWWSPAQLERMKVQDRIEKLRGKWREASHAVEISAAYQRAQSAANTLDGKLHAELNQAQAVQMLSRLVAAQKVKIQSQAFDAQRRQNGVETIYIDLALQGGYQGMRGILAQLMQWEQWVEVLELHMEHAAQDSTALKCRMSLAIYHLPQTAQSGNLPQTTQSEAGK